MLWAWRTEGAGHDRHDNTAASGARLGFRRCPARLGCGSDAAECAEAVSVAGAPDSRPFDGRGLKELRCSQLRLHDAEEARLQWGVCLQCARAAFVGDLSVD